MAAEKRRVADSEQLRYIVDWQKPNRFGQDKTPFANCPVIFGSKARTQLILALAINGPSPKRDIIKALNAGYCTMFNLVKPLEDIGVVCSGGTNFDRVHWLNKAHPAYRQFRALARVVDQQWPIPRWKAHRRPNVPKDAMPPKPPCKLFYYEPMTRCLLYIAAKGEASSTELMEMLGLAKGYNGFNGLKRLERDGIIRQAERSHPKAPMGYHLDPTHVAARPLRALLRAMLRVHSDIAQQAALAKKYRYPRQFKKNHGKPHLKGPSKLFSRQRKSASKQKP